MSYADALTATKQRLIRSKSPKTECNSDSTLLNPGASTDGAICIEDQSYAKTSLGINSNDTSGMHNVLGVQWDAVSDT